MLRVEGGADMDIGIETRNFHRMSFPVGCPLKLMGSETFAGPRKICHIRLASSAPPVEGMQEGLSAGITHGIEGRALTDFAAYNPSAEADYLVALHHLQSVNFSLLAELKSNKDASAETIMNLLRLDDHLADRLGLTASQPRADQLMVPIHHSPDRRVIGASALSLSLDVSNFRVQKIKENLANRVSALHNVFIPLSEPLSVAALTGTESTSAVVAAPTGTTTALSVTFASASVVRPISTDDYEVVQVDGHGGGGTEDQIGGNNVDPFPSVDDADLNLQ
ncbi:hypothetical protein Tco_1094484 [Tanacetum coccineum]|uniref:Uncharacterized protein n=1 Tax=Tanacetum coccineum TaxID=301880 RepID=A0ABQ5IGZ4_9ASTR